MILFSEELENDGLRKTYLVGDFSESKDKWKEVSYEICDELYVKCSCAFFETDVILYKHIVCIL